MNANLDFNLYFQFFHTHSNFNFFNGHVLASREDLNNITFFRTYDAAPAPNLNSTYTKPVAAESESYDMTPSRDELPPKPLKDEENYDIGDLRSDEVNNVIKQHLPIQFRLL